MLNELEISDVVEILSMYDIEYKMMNEKGRINYKLKKLYLNPLFDSDVETVMNEVIHHYLDVALGVYIPNDVIEILSMEYLKDKPEIRVFLEDYLN